MKRRFALAAFAAAALPRAVRSQPRDRIRMSGTYSDAFGEWLFVKAAGAFERAGFDVEGTPLPNAGAVAAAIGGGALELGIGDLISGINAIVKGVPNLLVAGCAVYLSTDAQSILAVPKDSPIRQPTDLNGKTIGVPTLVGLVTASLRAWLPEHGVNLARVKLVETTASAAFASVQRGVIDCTLLAEPFITPNREQLRDLGHPLDAVAKTFCQSVWYAAKPWFEADRERARRALNALYETGRWANAHRDETFAIMVRDAHFDATRLKGMARSTYLDTPLTPAMVQPVLNLAYQTKLFPQLLQADALIARA